MDNNLLINHLTISYKRKIAVQIENLIITKNQLTGIIGPNGAGKSTLLKGMLGLIPINRGEVVYKNQPVSRQLNKFAYVEQRQEIDLSFPIDVFGVVLLGTYPKIGLIKRPGKKEKELAWSCLEKVGMADFAHNQIGELSGGQLQRVFIARALAQEAEWIFLDEPFVGIDATSEKIIIDLLKQLRDEGKSIVIVHHDLHKVRDYFDQLVLLNKQVIAFGSVDQVFEVDNMKKTYGEEIAEMLRLGGK
ncbi:metal ABC transporter ATP-binding protein [Enterococcus sp. BWT-B8]|uniref:metal ABC transporter ATP-binding protein n=1 Tax=unclassified Enterococcus TaxID=2608891 RepID=UPI001E37F4D1|nr:MULTISPECIES: metal ABC transporter ATP-binding protein [unclassified Enterococcus]MCB5952434.1 metal ABC transporter ATP-binding protein [Enterococcus sp. BWT-B8]MCB5955386.1 metal ABC transporter ATP-binding protein [Enterococcus sp. CWB-B31]